MFHYNAYGLPSSILCYIPLIIGLYVNTCCGLPIVD